MGKGKGANLEKVAPVKSGQILFSINVAPMYGSPLVKILMKKISFKIPLKHQIILNAW